MQWANIAVRAPELIPWVHRTDPLIVRATSIVARTIHHAMHHDLGKGLL